MNEFLEKMREARKIEREQKKMKITPKGIENSIKERVPEVHKLMTHPSLVGLNTATQILNKVIKLEDEIKELRSSHKGVSFNDLFWEEKYELVYDLSYGKGNKGLPSQKNQYGITKGRMYGSTDVKNFRQDLKLQWGKQHDWDFPNLEFVMVHMTVYFPSKVQSDLDGKVTAILDALVKADIVKDDHWKTLAYESKAKFRKNRAGADIKIYKLSEEEFNKLIEVE